MSWRHSVCVHKLCYCLMRVGLWTAVSGFCYLFLPGCIIQETHTHWPMLPIGLKEKLMILSLRQEACFCVSESALQRKVSGSWIAGTALSAFMIPAVWKLPRFPPSFHSNLLNPHLRPAMFGTESSCKYMDFYMLVFSQCSPVCAELWAVLYSLNWMFYLWFIAFL